MFANFFPLYNYHNSSLKPLIWLLAYYRNRALCRKMAHVGWFTSGVLEGILTQEKFIDSHKKFLFNFLTFSNFALLRVRNTDNILMTHFLAQLKTSISWKLFRIETTCGRHFQTLMPLHPLTRPEISLGFVSFFFLLLDSIHALICSQGACSSLTVYGKTCLCRGFTHVHTSVILYVTHTPSCHRCQT